MTAQDSFATLIRHHLAPALRELGFKGSGGVFTLPDAERWALVGFQRSVHNDRQEVRFTANLTVGSKAVWQAARMEMSYLPERPAANTRYGSFIWQIRIGLALPVGRDTWWKVEPRTDLDALARDVIAAIRDHGLPAMQEQMTEDPGQGRPT